MGISRGSVFLVWMGQTLFVDKNPPGTENYPMLAADVVSPSQNLSDIHL
jgi:hypothetical protein